MPPSPILATPWRRQLVIALLMALLLALAMLLGTLLLGMRWVRVAQLHVPVPARWSVSQASQEVGPFSHLAVVQAHNGPASRLTVAQFKPQAVDSLEKALEAALRNLLGVAVMQANQQQVVSEFRTDRLRGLRADLITPVLRRPWRGLFHELAVVTDGSGRYWALVMERATADPDVEAEDQTIGTPLFTRICQGMKVDPPIPGTATAPAAAPASAPAQGRI